MLKRENSDYNYLLSFTSRNQFERILKYLLDENEFLSPFGIRSLSKYHDKNPFVLHAGGNTYTVSYTPGESTSNLFGGNSNWRGPIWLPGNSSYFFILVSLGILSGCVK